MQRLPNSAGAAREDAQSLVGDWPMRQTTEGQHEPRRRAQTTPRVAARGARQVKRHVKKNGELGERRAARLQASAKYSGELGDKFVWQTFPELVCTVPRVRNLGTRGVGISSPSSYVWQTFPEFVCTVPRVRNLGTRGVGISCPSSYVLFPEFETWELGEWG